MKSHRQELWFEIPGRRGFVNITPQVEQAVRESGVQEGLVLVNAMHITASVFINDDEPGLHHDYEDWLEELAPHEPVAALPPQPHRRGQRRRPPEAPGHGPRGGGGDHRRAASTSAPGSRSSTGSSTAGAASGCWSRSSGSEAPGRAAAPTLPPEEGRHEDADQELERRGLAYPTAGVRRRPPCPGAPPVRLSDLDGPNRSTTTPAAAGRWTSAAEPPSPRAGDPGPMGRPDERRRGPATRAGSRPAAGVRRREPIAAMGRRVTRSDDENEAYLEWLRRRALGLLDLPGTWTAVEAWARPSPGRHGGRRPGLRPDHRGPAAATAPLRDFELASRTTYDDRHAHPTPAPAPHHRARLPGRGPGAPPFATRLQRRPPLARPTSASCSGPPTASRGPTGAAPPPPRATPTRTRFTPSPPDGAFALRRRRSPPRGDRPRRPAGPAQSAVTRDDDRLLVAGAVIVLAAVHRPHRRALRRAGGALHRHGPGARRPERPAAGRGPGPVGLPGGGARRRRGGHAAAACPRAACRCTWSRWATPPLADARLRPAGS